MLTPSAPLLCNLGASIAVTLLSELTEVLQISVLVFSLSKWALVSPLAQAQHLSIGSLSWILSLPAKEISPRTALSRGLGASSGKRTK